MPAPAAGGEPTPLDKKAAKKAKKEKEKAEAAALKEAMAKPQDAPSMAVLEPEPEPQPEPVVAKAAPAAAAASSPKAAREAAMAALAGKDKEDRAKDGEEGEEEFDFEALLNQGRGSKKGKKNKKDKKGGKGKGGGDDFSFEAEAPVEVKERPAKAAQPEPEPEPEPMIVAKTFDAPDPPEHAAADDDEEAVQEGPTLEERVRSSRPPGRVRISNDGVAPGSVFVRLENVGVIFRNQEVIKEASWGVQTGERVGLVGPNGGGKTTQLKVRTWRLCNGNGCSDCNAISHRSTSNKTKTNSNYRCWRATWSPPRERWSSRARTSGWPFCGRSLWTSWTPRYVRAGDRTVNACVARAPSGA